MTEKKAKLSRRNFLMTVGVGGAAATAAAIVATRAPIARESRGPVTRAESVLRVSSMVLLLPKMSG